MARKRRPPRPGQLADLSPLKIATQIVTLQVLYYVCAAVLLLFTALVAGQPVSVDLLLSWKTIRASDTVGWTLALVWLLNSLVCVIFILLLIARSKLVLDFAATIHFLHLLVTSFYTKQVPRSPFWWGLQFTSLGVLTSLGVWACRWRELKPMTFGGTATSSTGGASGANGVGDPANGDGGQGQSDDGIGFGRGRGRGRGKDGGGEYEMV